MLGQQKHNNMKKLPFLRKALIISLNNPCLRCFPTDEMSEPLGNSTEISRSPHLVQRLETKEPKGSTVAPAYRTYIIEHNANRKSAKTTLMILLIRYEVNETQRKC